jgi:Ser-tRNA(Ala) deacylase AlaX
MAHVFYNTQKLGKSDYIEIVEYAKELGPYEIKLDKLDTDISWSRQPSYLTYDTYLHLLNKAKKNLVHFTVIRRWHPFEEKYYGEVSISLSRAVYEKVYVDEFLWIYLDIEKFDKLITKFNLISCSL